MEAYEKIGGVTLNLEDYPGEDLYSDGKVEDELLEIARDFEPGDFDRIVAERKSWPVMYHFSRIRGHILSFCRRLEGKRVLEIGAGCGALTGVLSEMAESVTCVELSKKRSLINAYRNRNATNIEIRVGNFEDVEKKLDGAYDVITLIGVFEYGVAYIHSADPYVDFLKKIRTHLKEDGVILIAIENRLGMKYFAGCTEDHTGGFFDGIEGYADTGYVRTFAKPEIEALFARAGLSDAAFYYPYPDYKFPMSVYSDGYLPRRGDLRNNIVNFDRKRLILFDESAAYDTLPDARLFPLFSNSFFIELKADGAGKEAETGGRLLFTKYSDERAEALRIRTDITEMPDGSRQVLKIPASGAASAHILAMEAREKALTEGFSGTRFVPNHVRIEDGNAVFPYLEGETLEEKLDRDFLKDRAAITAALLGYMGVLDGMRGESFVKSDGFVRVFGDVSLPAGLSASRVSDIDMVLNNVIAAPDPEKGKDAWHVIDYEWTFPFAVPLSFIKWRALHYYIEGNTKRFFLRAEDLYAKAGITEAEISVYEAMERHFQAYTEGDYTPLRELYGDISEGAADLPAILKRMNGRRGGEAKAKLYLDTGAGFREEETIEVDHRPDGSIYIEEELTGLKQLRIDPAEYAGVVTIDDLMTELGPLDPAAVISNGVRLDLRRFLFDTNDPYLIIAGWPEDAHFLYVTMHMASMDADSAEWMRGELDARDRRILALTKADAEKEALLSHRGAIIRQLMKTAPMKAYRKLRVTAKREDPYSMLRPLLPSSPDGILYCIDHMAHRRDDFFLRGWCFDRGYAGDRVFIVNSKDEEVPAEITRYRRPDAAKQFDLPEEREMGFTVRIDYALLKDLPFYLEVETGRGYTCEELPIESDPAKREEAEKKLRAKESEQHVITDYDDYADAHRPSEEELGRQRSEGAAALREKKPADAPFFSILVPLYKTDPALLDALIASVRQETWPDFELILSDGSGPDSPLAEKLADLQGTDPRIRVVRSMKPLKIAENTNAALDAARGKWYVFVDHDDLITPDALYEIRRAILQHEDAQLVYSDEDKLLPGDVPGEPNFKPDFSPEFLTSVNYICHLVAVRAELLTKTGLFDPAYDGAQDYDFLLRCMEHTQAIYHVPKVLYHWRMTDSSTAFDPAAKEYAFRAGARALSAHYGRCGIDADVTRLKNAGLYRTHFRLKETPLVSVIIPNKDHAEDLRRCIRSLEEKSSYKKMEYVVVENNSVEAETFALYEELKAAYPHLKVVKYEGAFNFSAINNLGVREASGSYLLFLNNDTELVAPGAVEAMLGHAVREEIGAVGARLYFADGSIQHAGVVLGYGGIAGHAFREFGHEEAGYQSRILVTQNVSAVTAACMMVRREVFDKVGGFSEELAVAFNDIDLCMRITEAGYRIVYEPQAEFMHYESKSRGYEDTPDKQARFTNEVRLFSGRWGERIAAGDPYYNPNLTLKRPDFTLRKEDE